jgi:hypothetical protein
MKKLLDESPDDLTRALLEAGRSQRPPAGNQAKLLLALGAGAGVGLFSSKAFAWLSTSAGKVTLASGVALGLAGAVSLALPPEQPEQREARLSPVAPAPAAVAPAAPALPVPALVDAPAVVATRSATSSSGAMSVPARRAHAPAASERRHRTAEQRRRIATRRDDAADPTETELAGPLAAVGARREPEHGAPEQGEQKAPAPGLDSEIQLVDALRGAAQRNDTEALRRLLEAYRGQFPDGQLRQEVSELALRSAAH